MDDNTMKETRAVQVSHELWQQMMTQGYTSGGVCCIKGLPEDARFVGVHVRDVPPHDPVFLFESKQWGIPDSSWAVNIDGTTYTGFRVEFNVAECRTCKHWGCYSYEAGQDERTCGKGVSDIPIPGDFGCVYYEPRVDK